MEVSIVIPAYNEGAIIASSIRRIISYMNENFKSYEIIVVNDGSKDDTAKILEDFKNDIRIIENRKNMGKGYSVRSGVIHASGKKIIFTDADLAYPLSEIQTFCAHLDKYDIVAGTRDRQKTSYPILRKMASNSFSMIKNIILPECAGDTQCGFKGFRMDTAKAVFEKCTLDGFGFDMEVICIAKLLGKSILNCPVSMTSYSKSNINFVTDPAKMLSDIFKIKLNLMTNHYTKEVSSPENARRYI